MTDAASLMRVMFDAAVAAASPARCVPPHLPDPPPGRMVVVGAGKAAAAMARVVDDRWPGCLEGLVVTRDGHGVPCRRIEVLEAAHPVPDARGEQAARRILAAVSGLSEDDLVLCLISGGGSALLTLPAAGITLQQKQSITSGLLASGASIGEINTVRKHLSAIKGGRLAAAAWPAGTLTLAISDIPGDDPAAIASGPTVPDPTTVTEARAVLAKYRIEGPPAVRRHLESPAAESPKPGDPRLGRARSVLVATPCQSLEAAAAVARARGFTAVILGDAIEGEARAVARDHARLAVGSAPGTALISGGETTVIVKGTGRGGRNTEYLLALALALDGQAGVHALAGDTDGIDGVGENAGAIIGPETMSRAQALGLDPRDCLDNNDAYRLFAALGDLVVTGPTLTNVNDFRVLLVTNS